MSVIIDESEVLDLLASLVDKSLVVYEEDERGGRYRLLETMRQYAYEELSARQEANRLHAEHVDFFVALAERAEPGLFGPQQSQWLTQLDREHDNLRTALEWSLVQEPAAATRLAGALWRFWHIRGLSMEGRKYLEGLLEASDAHANASVRAKAFAAAGSMFFLQGEYEHAAQSHERALALYRSVGDHRGIAFSLRNLAAQAINQGDRVVAKSLLDEAIAVAGAVGDQWVISHALNSLGVIAWIEGDLTAARGLYQESVEIARAVGDKQNLIYPLVNLARIECYLGDPTGSFVHCTEALILSRELGDQRSLAMSLEGIGEVEAGPGSSLRAARLFGFAHRLREVSNTPREPHDDHDRVVAATRAALGEAAFALAWNEGTRMSLDEAVDLALSQRTETVVRSLATVQELDEE